jgi:hypothetical protein
LKQKRDFATEYLNKQLRRFLFFVLRDKLNVGFKHDSVPYKNLFLPLYVHYILPQSAYENQIVVLDKKVDPNGDIWLGGYIRQRNYSNAFIALVSQGKLVWLKVHPGALETYSFVNKLEISPDGIIAIVHTIRGATHTNKLLLLGFNGNQKMLLDLQNPQMARYLSYDDINNIFLIGYCGYSLLPLNNEQAALVLERWNSNSKTLQWSKSFEINGSLIDVIRMDTTYYVFANAKKFKDLQGNELNFDLNGIVLVRLGFSGNIFEVKPAVNQEVFGVSVLKLSSRQINILAFDSGPVQIFKQEFASLPKLKYFLLQRE